MRPWYLSQNQKALLLVDDAMQYKSVIFQIIIKIVLARLIYTGCPHLNCICFIYPYCITSFGKVFAALQILVLVKVPNMDDDRSKGRIQDQ